MSSCRAKTSSKDPPDVATVGIRVFDSETDDFMLPNQALLIDITLYRDAGKAVFKIKQA